jgi:FkbM family methyltransferase
VKSRFFRGDYEQDELRMLALHLERSLPTIEIGACIGVVSCQTNKLLDDPTRHVVVEANPYLLPTLKTNRDGNGCHFEILNRALAYGSPTISFSIHELFIGGSVQRPTDEQIEVPTISLAGLLGSCGFETINLILDAEGAEIDLIEHEATVVAKHVARLIIEVHGRIVGEEQVASLMEKLERLGFERVEVSRGRIYDSIIVYINKSRSFEGKGAHALGKKTGTTTAQM